jgi:glycosyltransferase involved in cell wall biosynthesis
MKILLVSGIYPPDVGGPANFVPKLAKHLLELGHEPTIVTLKSKGSHQQNEFKVVYISRELPKIIRIPLVIFRIFQQIQENERIFANGLFFETALAMKFKKSQATAKIVGDEIWQKNFDTKKKNISALDFSITKQSLKNRLLRKISNWSFEQFDSLITPSRLLVDLVRIWGLSKPVHLIFNGVKIPKLNSREKKYDLITVSRLIPLKRIDKLIQIAAKLKLSLAIIGVGDSEADLKELAKSLSANVTFLGYRNQREIFELLQDSRYFSLLSIHEGLSFALLESMAAGTPPIASRVNGNESVVTDGFNGYLVDADNLEICTQQFEIILADKSNYDLISKNAIKTINASYSLEKTLHETSTIIIDG